MLRANQLIGLGGGVTGGPLVDIITRAGLTANFELCLDAGDINSYDGSSQTWSDVSGNGMDFYRGETSGSESSDPAFNGVAGALSSNEYFSFDGNDAFKLVAASNPTWVENQHKDNADFTLFAVFMQQTNSEWNDIWQTMPGGSNDDQGFRWAIRHSSDLLQVQVAKTGASVLQDASSLSPDVNEWHIAALSLDEAAGASGSFHFADGSFDTFNATYTSPGAGSADNPVYLATNDAVGGVGVNSWASGGRMACVAGWSRSLTQAEISSVYNSLRARFGL